MNAIQTLTDRQILYLRTYKHLPLELKENVQVEISRRNLNTEKTKSSPPKLDRMYTFLLVLLPFLAGLILIFNLFVIHKNIWHSKQWRMFWYYYTIGLVIYSIITICSIIYLNK